MSTQVSIQCHGLLLASLTSLSPGEIRCPRSDTHLTYMIDIALTAEFILDRDARWRSRKAQRE
jgi:hypothetical protein